MPDIVEMNVKEKLSVEKSVENHLTAGVLTGTVSIVIVLQKPVRPATGGAPAGAPFSQIKGVEKEKWQSLF